MTIKLYFLQASRSIRTAWHLEELGLDWDLEFSPRENKVAPAAFKKSAGDLGKFPTLVDGGESYFESGNIALYLEDKYDSQHKLLPASGKERYDALRWVFAAEGTYMTHCMPVIYARWFAEDREEDVVKGLNKNIVGDLELLEKQLNDRKFLMGERVSVADIMMHFSVQFMLARGINGGRKWEGIERWLRDCEATEGYRRAVEKTGYDIMQSG